MPLDPAKVKERPTPRFSINKLAEYAFVSNASRRRTIIRDQKFPSAFQAPRYNRAETAIKNFLASGASSYDDLEGKVEEWATEDCDTDFKTNQNRLCIDAVEAFMNLVDCSELEFEGMSFDVTKNDVPKMDIAGLEVSVRPELTTNGEYRKKTVNGAVKLYFAKNHPLTDESGPLVATAVHQFLEETLVRENPSLKHVQVIDVFRGTVYSAPKSNKARRKRLQDSAKDILAIWPTITL